MKEENTFNPWPYGLAATLIAFCLIQFSLVATASSSFEGLDDVEYYRHGIEYGAEIDRQERQKDLEWTIAHQLTDDNSRLQVALLDADQKPIMRAKVKVRAGRPATIRDDRHYELKEVGPGVYAAPVELATGKWKFDLEAEKGENLVKVEFRHQM